MITTDLLSSLLLQLYQASRELTMGEFQECALRLIEQHIPFDGVWWAMSTQVNNKYHVHGSFIRGLPNDCTDLLNLTPGQNIVAKSCSENSGVTMIFGPEKLNGNFETAFLANHMTVRHCICTETNDPLLGLSTFISLTRRTDERPFSAAERQ